ncbi:MAG: hypothetical protein ACE5NC_09315 [Anaerolineae bacterium]
MWSAFAQPVGDRWAVAYPKDEYHEDFDGERLFLFPTRMGPFWRPHKVGTRAQLAAEGVTFASREAAVVAATWWWDSDALPHQYKKWLTLHPDANEEAWRYDQLHGLIGPPS